MNGKTMNGKTQITPRGYRSRKGTLPSGAKYTATRDPGEAGGVQSQAVTKGHKRIITKNRDKVKAGGSSLIVNKKGVTPGGRAYDSTRITNRYGVSPIKSKDTTVATNNKSSTLGETSGRYRKNTTWGGETKKWKRAERTGSIKAVKKGPTAPRPGVSK